MPKQELDNLVRTGQLKAEAPSAGEIAGLMKSADMSATQWRVLADAHRKRNQIEYEGTTEVDSQFLEAVLRVTHELAKRVRALVAAGAGS